MNIINVHIHLIRNELRQANSKIIELQPTGELHFYDYYHYVYLLDKLGLSHEIKSVLPYMRKSIRDDQIMHIKRSQEHMATCFELLYCERQRKINDIKSEIERMNRYQEKDGNLYLNLYIQLKELMPKSVKVNLAIIKMVANNNIAINDYRRIVNVLADCNRVVIAQLSNDDKVRMNYKDTYTKALEKIA